MLGSLVVRVIADESGGPESGGAVRGVHAEHKVDGSLLGRGNDVQGVEQDFAAIHVYPEVMHQDLHLRGIEELAVPARDRQAKHIDTRPVSQQPFQPVLGPAAVEGDGAEHKGLKDASWNCVEQIPGVAGGAEGSDGAQEVDCVPVELAHKSRKHRRQRPRRGVAGQALHKLGAESAEQRDQGARPDGKGQFVHCVSVLDVFVLDVCLF